MHVIPTDPALQSMQTFFPAAGLPDFIAEADREMVGHQVEPENAEIAYVRYRPTEQCTVAWRFPTASGPPLLLSGSKFCDDCGAVMLSPLRALRAQLQACDAPWDTPAPPIVLCRWPHAGHGSTGEHRGVEVVDKKAADGPEAKANLREQIARCKKPLATLGKRFIRNAKLAPRTFGCVPEDPFPQSEQYLRVLMQAYKKKMERMVRVIPESIVPMPNLIIFFWQSELIFDGA